WRWRQNLQTFGEEVRLNDAPQRLYAHARGGNNGVQASARGRVPDLLKFVPIRKLGFMPPSSISLEPISVY
ncbi:MAG: hypothetical protein JRM98_05260, partial [Nitrososphaerota archaeon]|nr:hypothetical protein [Nitrososphaerota archaeon]